MRQFDAFFPSEEVLALTTKRGMDFTQVQGDQDLTEDQKQFLMENAGIRPQRYINIRQVHGDHILVVRSLENYSFQEADGIIMDMTNIPAVIRTADCVPVFVYAKEKRVIGLFHAGWKSARKRILFKGLELMREGWDVSPEEVMIFFGPCIHRNSCEVKDFFREYFPNEIFEEGGKLFLDLPLANKHQAMGFGVPEKNIRDSKTDTFADKECFSYRRGDVESGRMLSLMMMK